MTRCLASGVLALRLAWSCAAAENAAIRTPVELFADAAELAIAGRAADWLDHLIRIGALTPGQRTQIAAKHGTSRARQLHTRKPGLLDQRAPARRSPTCEGGDTPVNRQIAMSR